MAKPEMTAIKQCQNAPMSSLGGIDLNRQPTGCIFEKGFRLGLRFGTISTLIPGADLPASGDVMVSVAKQVFR